VVNVRKREVDASDLQGAVKNQIARGRPLRMRSRSSHRRLSRADADISE
jgi:hypothetical protein